MGTSAVHTAVGAVAAHTARGEAPEQAAKRRAVSGLRGRALDALVGDGGVGRERVSVSPGSVSFGDGGKLGVSAPVLPGVPSCTVHRRVAFESWLPAEASVAQSMSRVDSAKLDRVAGVGTFLLRWCQDSIASFVATVGTSSLAPHIWPDSVRHWFGTIKQFPAITQLLRVLSSGSPVCVARGGDLNTELDYGNHPSSLPHEGAIVEKVCANEDFGRALVLDLGSAAEIRGLRISPLAVVLKPKFRIVHNLTFARAGG